MEELEISFTAVGVEGGCPAEQDNEGCFFIDKKTEQAELKPPEIMELRTGRRRGQKFGQNAACAFAGSEACISEAGVYRQTGSDDPLHPCAGLVCSHV